MSSPWNDKPFWQRAGEPFSERPDVETTTTPPANPPPGGTPPANRPPGPIQPDWVNRALQYVKASVGPPATQWAERAKVAPNGVGDDASGPGIAGRLSVGASLGSLTEQVQSLNLGMERLHKWLTANPRGNNPIIRQLAGSGIGSAATYMYIDLGTTPGGYIRDIRRVSVYGMPDPFATLAAVNVLLIKYPTKPPDSSNELLSFPDMIAAPGIVPNDSEWGPSQVRLRLGENLILVLKGVASGQIVVASGEAEDYLESTLLGVEE